MTLFTANSHASLSVTCNYGAVGNNETFWFAEDPSVTAGTIATTNVIHGLPIQAFNDLAWGQGSQGNALLGAWPWQGVFTANEGGTLSRFDITVTGSAGGDCTAVVYASGGGPAFVLHP